MTTPIPVLLCAYRPKYLHATLPWLLTDAFRDRYRLFAWDNGGAADVLRRFGLEWQCIRDEPTGRVRNVGKALAMQHLVDAVDATLPDSPALVCMDDDIAVDAGHLDALVAAAQRPGVGMVAGCFHPFHSVRPAGGTSTRIGPDGPTLRTYPAADRTVGGVGRVAGGLFAVSRASIALLPWRPRLYPILADANQEAVPYWTEDASLDHALTVAGRTNGYLESADVVPALHLPDLDEDYARWKKSALMAPTKTKPYFDPLS